MYDKIKIMKNRILALTLASAVCACLIGGCGNGDRGSIIILEKENEQTAKTSLSFYGHRTDRSSLLIIEDALQSYMIDGRDAFYENAEEIEYWNSLDTRFRTNNLDDLFMIDRDRLLFMHDSLADLTDIIDVNLYNEFTRSQLFSADGKIYAAPTGISTYGLYVNYDLLQKHGKPVPRNFSEFTEVCNYFVEQGIIPVISNNQTSLRSLIIARGMFGVYSSAETAKEIAKFNADPLLLTRPLNDGIDLVYTILDNGWIDVEEAALTAHLSGDLDLFANGTRPFMVTGGWASSSLKYNLKKQDITLSYGIHAYPVLDSASVLVAQTDSLVSVKKGGNENEAKKLVSVLTHPQTILELNENQSRFTVLNGHTQINSDSAIIPSASYLTKGKYVIGSDSNLSVPLDAILDKCVSSILKGRSADEVKAQLAGLLTAYKEDGK